MGGKTKKERDWGSERYARLYTRDTPNWIMMPWQGRALVALLIRKLDRDGRVPLGAYGVSGLAQLVGLPAEVTQVGFDALTRGDDATLVVEDGVLFMPKFEAAQETLSSGAKRTAKWRAKQAGVTPAVTGDADGDGFGPVGDANVTPSVRPSVPSSDALDLEALYALYPRKRGKARGLKLARAQITTPDQYAKLKAAIENYARAVKRDGAEAKYVKHFSSFMAAEVWPEYAETAETEPTDAYQAQGADLLERA